VMQVHTSEKKLGDDLQIDIPHVVAQTIVFHYIVTSLFSVYGIEVLRKLTDHTVIGEHGV
jgi:hypothetical protein